MCNLSEQEFWRACQELQAKVIRFGADISWQAVSSILIEEKGSTPFIQITRTLIRVSGLSTSDHAPQGMFSDEVAEEIEDNVIYSSPQPADRTTVHYSILYSVSYQVPVLYFQVVNVDETINQLQFVYDQLVPKSCLGELQSIGIIGGISQTDHPATDVPCFYVHPCRTAEAMQSLTVGRKITPDQYMQLWIGLIGSAVGLNLPVELAV